MSWVHVSVPGSVQCSLPLQPLTPNWTTSQTTHTFQMKSSFMLFPQPEHCSYYFACQKSYSVFRLNLKSPSFMKVSCKLPLFPPTGSNHSLLYGPYTSLKTQPSLFSALWSIMYQLIFPSEGKCCLNLLHSLKSKSLRIMYKVLVTWWLLPFESYVLTFPSVDLIPES